MSIEDTVAGIKGDAEYEASMTGLMADIARAISPVIAKHKASDAQLVCVLGEIIACLLHYNNMNTDTFILAMKSRCAVMSARSGSSET